MVIDGVSRRFEMLPEDFFDKESGVIRADGDARLESGFSHSDNGRDCIEERFPPQFDKTWCRNQVPITALPGGTQFQADKGPIYSSMGTAKNF